MADDNLDAPLGKRKKRKPLKLPVALPQVVAGLLGLSIAVVGGWTVLASNPYGGQPIAVVAMGTDGAKDAKAAPAQKAAGPAEAAEASLRGHLKGDAGKEQTGSQSYVPPDPKDDKALIMADELLRGTQKNSAFPPNPKAPVPN